MKRLLLLCVLLLLALIPAYTSGNPISADPNIETVVQKSGTACVVFTANANNGFSAVKLIRVIDQNETVLYNSDDGAFAGMTKKGEYHTYNIYADTCVQPGDVFYKIYADFNGQEMYLGSKMIEIEQTEDPCDDTDDICEHAADYLVDGDDDDDDEDEDDNACGC